MGGGHRLRRAPRPARDAEADAAGPDLPVPGRDLPRQPEAHALPGRRGGQRGRPDRAAPGVRTPGHSPGHLAFSWPERKLPDRRGRDRHLAAASRPAGRRSRSTRSSTPPRSAAWPVSTRRSSASATATRSPRTRPTASAASSSARPSAAERLFETLCTAPCRRQRRRGRRAHARAPGALSAVRELDERERQVSPPSVPTARGRRGGARPHRARAHRSLGRRSLVLWSRGRHWSGLSRSRASPTSPARAGHRRWGGLAGPEPCGADPIGACGAGCHGTRTTVRPTRRALRGRGDARLACSS